VFTALRVCRRYRADEGNRTPNLLITNQLLYQLSYVSLKQAEKRQTPMIRGKLGRVNILTTVSSLALLSRYFHWWPD
jgi:hypothetical protein